VFKISILDASSQSSVSRWSDTGIFHFREKRFPHNSVDAQQFRGLKSSLFCKNSFGRIRLSNFEWFLPHYSLYFVF
jgi:hypothetical protein